MKITRKAIIGAALLLGAATIGTGYTMLHSELVDPVAFYSGHTHTDDGVTVGAPSHSGGTDKYGCHNASVPYHCH